MERNDEYENFQDYNLVGHINTFRVLRETKLGYILESDAGDEYFLHHNECCGRKLFFNDEVKAFAYVDKMKRIACTLADPAITIDKPGFGRVVGKNANGVFININISKDILYSPDVYKDVHWPNIDDYLLGVLKLRSKNLCFKPLNKFEILELNKGTELEVDKKYFAYVYRISEDGINLVTEDFNVIFVHKNNIRNKTRIGEKLEVKIVKKNEDDYSGTLIEQKELERLSDADIILEYLTNHNGVMNYGDATDPDIIQHVFNMSKSAFKRALGALYSKGLVELGDKKTVLKR